LPQNFQAKEGVERQKKNYEKSLFPLTELAISNMIHNDRKGGILKNNIS